MFRKYKKKLEKLFKREEIGRKQLNFACDINLIARLKLLASYLDIPLYPLAEHVLELGISEITVIVKDKALTESLQRHLLEDHLLVGRLNPADKHTSDRATRIENALNFLNLIESKSGNLEDTKRVCTIAIKNKGL